ncbi:MAG: hypothetical protein AB7O24_17695 [Kofleriaceae bacterium]
MDRGVIAAASELFESKHYTAAAAICAEGLKREPNCLQLLLLSARSFVALRREADARADLRDILRFAPECALAYRLLGELAARREENETAAIFFREALRLDPSDLEAADWLQIVTASARPAAVAIQLPATAAAAGRISRAPRVARGTEPEPDDLTNAVERPFSRGSEPSGNTWSGAAWSVTAPSLPPPPNEVVPGVELSTADAPTVVTAPIVVEPDPEPVPASRPSAVPLGRVSKHLIPAAAVRERPSFTERPTAPQPIRIVPAPAALSSPAFRDPPSVSEGPTAARPMRIVAAPPIADLPAVPQPVRPSAAMMSRPSAAAVVRRSVPAVTRPAAAVARVPEIHRPSAAAVARAPEIHRPSAAAVARAREIHRPSAAAVARAVAPVRQAAVVRPSAPAVRPPASRTAMPVSGSAAALASVATPRFAGQVVARHADPLPRMSRASMPELPGFAEFLITAGVITRDRLRAAQAYQRSMKVQLATAIVTLGLASAERVEWAVVAHQSQLARSR